MGFPTKPDSNQSHQLQRLARIWKFHMKQVEIWYFPPSGKQKRWSDCACVVPKPQRQVFSSWSPYIIYILVSPKYLLWQTVKNQMKCTILSVYTLFAQTKVIFRANNTIFIWYETYNLWLLNTCIHKGPFQVYCIKPDGQIHYCIKANISLPKSCDTGGLWCFQIFFCLKKKLCYINNSLRPETGIM